jgi:hypothetical protein
MSPLNDLLQGYLSIRRGFGCKLETHEKRLRNFLAFMGERNAITITGKLAIEWAGGGCGPASWSSRLSTKEAALARVQPFEPGKTARYQPDRPAIGLSECAVGRE